MSTRRSAAASAAAANVGTRWNASRGSRVDYQIHDSGNEDEDALEENDVENEAPTNGQSRRKSRNDKAAKGKKSITKKNLKSDRESNRREVLLKNAEVDPGDLADDPTYEGPPRNAIQWFQDGRRKTEHTPMEASDLPVPNLSTSFQLHHTRNRILDTGAGDVGDAEIRELTHSKRCFKEFMDVIDAELAARGKGRKSAGKITMTGVNAYDVLTRSIALCGMHKDVKDVKRAFINWLDNQQQALHVNGTEVGMSQPSSMRDSLVLDPSENVEIPGYDDSPFAKLSWDCLMDVLGILRAFDIEAWVKGQSHVVALQKLLVEKDPKGWSSIRKAISELRGNLKLAEYKEGVDLLDRVRVALDKPCSEREIRQLIAGLEIFRDANSEIPALRFPISFILHSLTHDEPWKSELPEATKTLLNDAVTSLEDIFEERVAQVKAVALIQQKVIDERIMDSRWTGEEYREFSEHLEELGNVSAAHTKSWFVEKFSPSISQMMNKFGSLDLNPIEKNRTETSPRIDDAQDVPEIKEKSRDSSHGDGIAIEYSVENPDLIILEMNTRTFMTSVDETQVKLRSMLAKNGVIVSKERIKTTPSSVIMSAFDIPETRGNLHNFLTRAKGLAMEMTCMIGGVTFNPSDVPNGWPRSQSLPNDLPQPKPKLKEKNLAEKPRQGDHQKVGPKEDEEIVDDEVVQVKVKKAEVPTTETSKGPTKKQVGVQSRGTCTRHMDCNGGCSDNEISSDPTVSTKDLPKGKDEEVLVDVPAEFPPELIKPGYRISKRKTEGNANETRQTYTKKQKDEPSILKPKKPLYASERPPAREDRNNSGPQPSTRPRNMDGSRQRGRSASPRRDNSMGGEASRQAFSKRDDSRARHQSNHQERRSSGSYNRQPGNRDYGREDDRESRRRSNPARAHENDREPVRDTRRYDQSRNSRRSVDHHDQSRYRRSSKGDEADLNNLNY